ncbi:MAG: ComF family protein [Ignavibacteriales bacterium]|nr:ComF family protein [Ignavibacteriales bacterium]HOJ17395.1 ComF family protein [Ignavibacteriaceae bacterium]HPO56399.1 ComF family protein [Ignavibacteriaceae bacterium]
MQIKAISSLFFPEFCSICENKVNNGNFFHDECIRSLSLLAEETIETEFVKTFGHDSYISDHFFLFWFDDEGASSKVIHSIKYRGRFRLARYLGQLLGEKIAASKQKWKADMIIPIPLHRLRKAERGYNQSECIGEGIMDITGISVCNNILKRIKYTGTQTQLTLRQRKLNIKGAFGLKNAAEIKGKRIIIVDDVLTTGSTLIECAKLLYIGGAEALFAASLAKTLPKRAIS